MKVDLPTSLNKYFWGDDLNDIKWPKGKNYIVQTLLEKGNKDAIGWLFGQVDKSQIVRMLPGLRLSQKSLNFWTIYLA